MIDTACHPKDWIPKRQPTTKPSGDVFFFLFLLLLMMMLLFFSNMTFILTFFMVVNDGSGHSLELLSIFLRLPKNKIHQNTIPPLEHSQSKAPKMNSSPLKNDGWKTIRLHFWGPAKFSAAMLNFQGVLGGSSQLVCR